MTAVRARPRTAAMLGLGLLALLAFAALVLSLESTQEKSRRLAQEGGKAFDREGLRITRRSANVEVVRSAVMEDPNGASVAVTLRNSSDRTLAGVPIAIEVTDAAGKTVFRNDEPGLEPSLTFAPVMEPGETRTWVHDQVYPDAGRPAEVEVEVGAESAKAPAAIPEIQVGKPRFEADPSGLAATGYIYNRSKVEQRKLVIFASSRKGRRVVASGRGQVQRLKAGRRARYTIFFIGDPRKGKLELWAPPAVLEEGAEPVGETAPQPGPGPSGVPPVAEPPGQ